MNSHPDTAVPVPAATVLAIRDGEVGLEVFMIQRHHKMAFMSGAFVFPGGKTDAQDEELRLRSRCDGPEDALCVYRIAALREAFEECGVLLARRAGQASLIDGEAASALAPWRDRLHKGDVGLYDFLIKEDLRLACDLLTRFAHWVTPVDVPRRFDTQFFLVPAPEDQVLAHDGHESVNSLWINPQAAMDAEREGTFHITFPTLSNLQKLAETRTVAKAIDAANASQIVKVLPRKEIQGDDEYLVLPEAAGYPVSRMKIPKRSGARRNPANWTQAPEK